MKQPGDAVAKDEAIVELETDKAAQELVAPEAGVMGEILVAEGEVAKVGQTLATLMAGASGGSASAAPASTPAPAAAASGDAIVMPAAAKIIRDHGLDASLIKGTGKGGRILKADALAAVANPPKAASAPASAPKATSAPAAPKAPRDIGPREDRVRMTRIRQTIARRLKDAQNTAAMLTTYNEADMTAIMDMRKQYKAVSYTHLTLPTKA